MKLIMNTGKFESAKEFTRIVGVFNNSDKAKITCPNAKNFQSAVDSLEKANVFSGKSGSHYFLRGNSENCLFIGLGKSNECQAETLRIAGSHAYKSLEKEKVSDAALCLPSFYPAKSSKMQKTDVALALSEGLALSNYNFDKYKSKPAKKSLKTIGFYCEKSKAIQAALDVAQDTADAVNIARDLSNEPGSHLYPMTLAKEAKRLAKVYGLKCSVLETAALKKEKCGGILGVGQGSAKPPCLIVLQYKPKKATKKTKKIAFVGKAITFDSGGISIKPSGMMEDMKHDMSGGSTMIGAICLAAKLNCPNEVTAYIAAAENMPDGNAIVPSTILHTRSGKTVEVHNTDAEGRLVLCDALDYAQDRKPDVILDMATLTGAVVVALGTGASAIMGNDKKTIEKIIDAGKKCGEEHWELPIYKLYSDDLKSKIADIKNIGSNREAGSSKAGAFLQEFIRDKQKWAHFDVAATAWNMRHLPYCPSHGASGYSMRTVVKFAMDYK